MDLLERFNEKERSIEEIWNKMGNCCPMIVRSYDQGEEAAVLVSQVCKGIPYGFPLRGGRRIREGWYKATDIGSVRIPEGTSPIWNLVAMPFDDLQAILSRLDLDGALPGRPQTKPVAAPIKKSVAPAVKPAVKPAPSTATPAIKPAVKPAPTATTKPAVKPAPAAKAPEDGLERKNGSVVLPFGRYKGKSVAEVKKADPDYIPWALANIPAIKEILEKEQ